MEIPPRLNRHLLATRPPAIAQMNALARQAAAAGADLVDLGQAVPDYAPPAAAIQALAARLEQARLHRYAPDPGLPELREAWAHFLERQLQIRVDPHRELMITAGANQGYLMALMTILDPGDAVGLLSPWYFNHAMAVEMLGCRLVEIPLAAQDGYQLDVDLVLDAVRRQGLKAVTLVSPNNPCGVTYQPASIEELAIGLLELGVYLLFDETYAFFAPPSVPHFSPARLEDRPELVITLGSFSKTFGMAGWRVGYVAASRELLEQMLKVQDTMIICASRPGQELALAALEAGAPWIARRRDTILARERLLLELAPELAPWRIRSHGCFFAMLDGPMAGQTVAHHLALEHGVLVVPAGTSGSGLDGSFRLSFGCADAQRLKEGISRMSLAFGSWAPPGDEHEHRRAP